MAICRKQVTTTTYPYLRIAIKLRRNITLRVLALIDTGFTGHVAIPKDVLNGDLGFPDLYLTWRMADGTQVNAPAYQGAVTVVALVLLILAATGIGIVLYGKNLPKDITSSYDLTLEKTIEFPSSTIFSIRVPRGKELEWACRLEKDSRIDSINVNGVFHVL